ncbi:MAG: NAD(+) kinase, partial [Chitinophagaceae bacterium]
MKAAIYSRIMEEAQRQNVQVFFDELEKQSIEPVIFAPFYDQIKSHIRLPADTGFFSVSEDLSGEIEFIISLGGDGTLLDTVTLVRDKDIPIMGINFGRLGFLASIGQDEVKKAVQAIARRTYVTDKRTLIHL